MDRISAARKAENYNQLVVILQQMDADELKAVDDGSLPSWGKPLSRDSVLSWDTDGLEGREVRVVYADGGARLSFRDDGRTIG